jgi:triacylglycerol lipase
MDTEPDGYSEVVFGGIGDSVYWRVRSAIDEAWCLSRLARSYHRLPADLDEADGAWCRAESVFSTPVVLVHGAAHNGSAWTAMSESLRVAGFERLVALDYRAERDPIALAVDLGRRLEQVRERARADRIHVVGHSLGGFLLRMWHDALGGREHTHAAVTLGTPHHGTRLAGLPTTPARLRCLRPGSRLLRHLGALHVDHSHWTTITAGGDMLVPDASLPGARSVRVEGIGHTGLLYSRTAAGQVCFALLAAEEEAIAWAAPERVPVAAAG